MAEFKSESGADFIPESVAGLLRNQHPVQLGRFARRYGPSKAARTVKGTPASIASVSRYFSMRTVREPLIWQALRLCKWALTDEVEVELPLPFGRYEFELQTDSGDLVGRASQRARKPGALRNGAPFKDWPLPAGLERVRRKLRGTDDGDRQMVKVLSAVLTDGLATVAAACAEALAGGVHSADVILNIRAGRRDPVPAAMILTPETLRLRDAPIADCARYDRLRKAS
jgi:hypothetical protein